MSIIQTWIKKSWSISNCGSSVWDGYVLRLVYGVGKNAELPVTRPGQEIDVTAQVYVSVADYIALYSIENADGLRFGQPFWFLTGSDLLTVRTKPPTQKVAQGKKYCATVREVTALPKQIQRGKSYKEVWELTNCGTWTWQDITIIGTYGNTGIKSPTATVRRLAPGQKVNVTITTNVPSTWEFNFVHNIRELNFQNEGVVYRFGEPISSFALVQA